MNQKMKFTKYRFHYTELLDHLKSFKHLGKRGVIKVTLICFSAGWIVTSIFANAYCFQYSKRGVRNGLQKHQSVNSNSYSYEKALQAVRASLSINEENLSFATWSNGDGYQDEMSPENIFSMLLRTALMVDNHILNSAISKNAPVTRLNQAFLYPEDAGTNNGMGSYAGRIYKEMTLRESGWLSEVYNLSDMTPAQMADRIGKPAAAIQGKYNPLAENQDPSNPGTWAPDHWTKVEVSFRDGDGNVIQGGSNVKEIMSMANVYSYHHDLNDYNGFTDYIRRLWEDSHRLDIQMSDIYYCSGCQQQTAGAVEASEGEQAAEETVFPEYITSVEGPYRDILESQYIASLSEAGENVGETGAPAVTEGQLMAPLCPGHLDLKVTATIAGLGEASGLYALDQKGNSPDHFNESWQGWTEEARGHVNELQTQDWYDLYGLTTTGISLANPLTAAEIEAHIRQLPAGISQDRIDVIRFALSSVGKVPYYWGGKPSSDDYDGNSFATVTVADDRGRMLRGLDCSGWVKWVYWSSIGKELPYEGTGGLSGLGKRIKRDQLQPGDIIVKTGEDSHVVMFLGWGEEGKMKCIHETGGGVNNVIISEMNANYPYYRNLLD